MQMNQHAYMYLRQNAKRRVITLHSYLEVEEAIDKMKGVSEHVSKRRRTDMLYEQVKGRWYGFKAKAFGA